MTGWCIYIIVYAHVIYITSSSRKIDTHHCCCNLKHQESIAIPSTYTKIRHVSPGKNWVDVGGNSYSFGVPSLSSLGYPFSRIVHLRCQRPRRFETVGLVGLGLSVLSIPGIQPSIWWKLLRAHFVFWGYHQEISRKFHGIFLAFLFTFFWYFGAAPNWSTTKKTGLTLRLFPKFQMASQHGCTIQLVQFMGMSSFPPQKNAVIYHD